MYAIIKSGGKHYKVTPGARVRLEKLAVEPGAEVELGEVLAVSDGDQLLLG